MHFGARHGFTDDFGAALSPRESEVLGHVAEGLGNRQIGALLGIQIGTVKQHLVKTLRKLGVSNRTAAAVWWTTHVP